MQVDAIPIHSLGELLALRLLVLAGALALILYGLWAGVPLPAAWLLGLIALHAGASAWSWWRLRGREGVGQREILWQLLGDVLVLSGLLYLTGGSANPFTWVLLFPVILASTLLSKGQAWGIALLTLISYSALMFFHVPFPGMHPVHGSGFGLHVLGMWVGYMGSALLVTYFVTDITQNLRERERHLAALREQALRDERLIALGTLAAGAAHELGTPLGTIALLAQELEEEYPKERDPGLHQRLGLISGQVRRCKEALATIGAASGEEQAVGGALMPLGPFLTELAAEWRRRRPGVKLDLVLEQEATRHRLLADTTLRQALVSILDNAADASPQAVSLEARRTGDALTIEVCDRGAGLQLHQGAELGHRPVASEKEGLGLGLFLAHAAIGRLGGRILLRDREDGGLCTRITLPIAREERHE